MKCHGQTMVLNTEEFIWSCRHCYRERFAVRSAYNFLKKEAGNYKNKKKFIAKWVHWIQPLAERAWNKSKEPAPQAEDICVLIDEIELKSKDSTLEEWKQYKHIRNAIRDKYVLTHMEEAL